MLETLYSQLSPKGWGGDLRYSVVNDRTPYWELYWFSSARKCVLPCVPSSGVLHYARFSGYMGVSLESGKLDDHLWYIFLVCLAGLHLSTVFCGTTFIVDIIPHLTIYGQ